MERLHAYNDYKGLRQQTASRLLAILCFSILLSLSNAAEIQAVSFQLPPPPFLSGPLESNAILTEAERVHDGRISAPHSYVRYKEDIFAVTAAGTVVNVVPCSPVPVVIADLTPRSCIGPKECGHLVSIRLSSRNTLLVLDAYRGLFEVHPVTGVKRQLYSSKTITNGRPSYYLTDVLELPDGRILMSDASAIFDYAKRFWIIFEGRADGRLLVLNPTTGQVQETMAGLAYPSGLELTIDKRAFLLSEASRSRIYKVELSQDRPFFKSVFAENLPGMPQHIRRANKGVDEDSYWVGLTFPRYQGDISVLDQYSAQPAARNFLAQRRSEQQLKMMYNIRGLAVELDVYGQIIHSMHDPTTSKVMEVTEVNEHAGLAYVGTRNQNAVLRVMTSATRLSVDTMIEVMRSRCKVTEDKILEAKEALRKQVMNRQNAANGNQNSMSESASVNVPAMHPSSPTQSKHKPLPPNSDHQIREKSLGFSKGTGQSEERNSTSFREGLSLIQNILSRRGLQSGKKRTSVGNQYLSTSPQSPQKLPTPPVVDSWKSKDTQTQPQEQFPLNQASFQQHNPPQSTPQQFFNQPYKQADTKLPARTTQQKDLQGFPSQSRRAFQTPSFLDRPPIPSNNISPNNMRTPYQQNMPMQVNIPIPPPPYSQAMGGITQVYAPNGNVPLPFAATGFQNSFAQFNTPQTNLQGLNLEQSLDPYQGNSRDPNSIYSPPSRNTPTDSNSPFLAHGLVPTGHHSAIQSTYHDHDNKPQIVHKFVNGQMITQIIVPDLDTILYDRTEPKTTTAPFVLATPRPATNKADEFKSLPTPQSPLQVLPKKPPQSETQKKLALGGFLGIAPKQSNSDSTDKPPLFHIGPEMVNTFPEFGQMPGSALDASPIGNGIYGLDSAVRPPTARERNAAIALNMFTGVTDPTNAIPKEENQMNKQDPPTTPVYQEPRSYFETQSNLLNKTIIIGTAQEIPKTLARVDNSNSLNKELPHAHGTHMSPASDDSNAATVRNIDAKSTDRETKETVLKRGLQQLHQLFRKENSRISRPQQVIQDTVKEKQNVHTLSVSETDLAPITVPHGTVQTSRTLHSSSSILQSDNQQRSMLTHPQQHNHT
ncbi:hypothetical protein EGW08_002882 [Elysia chlorotica]|uniref:Strictosidine synthase conserved region domain-containing protein n=1 Tax=Elysia chlorotica TaxID=188477 RepID=A0A3S1A321_ELYCH|nr:hypothetical protein EGW08_002882 [Elysia chlorotica]